MDFFRFGLFLDSSATDIVLVTLPSTAVETAIAQWTSRWAIARGHRLNTSIVLAAVHCLSGLFRAVSAVEPSIFHPLPPCPRQAKCLHSFSIAKMVLKFRPRNCGYWISCANEDIESALSRLGVVLRSKLIQETPRNRDGKLTHLLTGRRFVFMNVPSFTLEKSVKSGGFSARL